jgi:hypothetical protein
MVDTMQLMNNNPIAKILPDGYEIDNNMFELEHSSAESSSPPVTVGTNSSADLMKPMFVNSLNLDLNLEKNKYTEVTTALKSLVTKEQTFDVAKSTIKAILSYFNIQQ